MEVMVIYVWQCMVVLLYDCICARWLWSMMNEDATATSIMKGCTLMIDCRGYTSKKGKRGKERKSKEKKEEKHERKNGHGRIRTCDLLLVKPTLLSCATA